MKVTTQLWNHQQQALDFAMAHPASAMFMGMGTGKTLVALKWIEQNDFKRVLIFCPYRVVRVWFDETIKHCKWSDLGVVKTYSDKTIAGRTSELKLSLDSNDKLIAVMNYETVGRKNSEMIKYLKNNYDKFDAVILDESHRIKAPGSRTSWFFKWLGSKIEYKLCLTGTPMPNSKMDIYGQYRFLDRSVFGTNYNTFRFRYGNWGGYNNYQLFGYINEEEFNERVDSIAFRVDSDEVLDLPDEVNLNYYAKLSNSWRKYYNKLEKDFYLETQDGELTVPISLVKILRLQQIAGGNIQYDDTDGTVVADSAKLNLAIETIDDIGDENIVVFYKYSSESDALRARTKKPYELSGRMDQLDEWNRDGGILLVQISAGSEGIDLTNARYVIFYSIGYSLGQYEQAKRRVRRPGARLDAPVTYINLIVEDTVDEAIYESIQNKREAVESVLEAMKNKYE